MDHAQLVHAQWTQAAKLQLGVHVLRVGTHDNIADLPSRRAFDMLRVAGAKEIEPVLWDSYWGTGTWEALQELWRL